MKSAILTILAVFFFSFLNDAHGEVKFRQQAAGGMIVSSDHYTAEFTSAGTMRSLKVSGVEFLETTEWSKAGLFAVDYVPPGNIGIVSDRLPVADTSKIDLQGTKLKVSGERITLEFTFRETGFDLVGQSTVDRDRLMLIPSEHVRLSLDSLTDRVISMAGGKVVGMQQEGMRWATKQGPMLRFDERLDGYASFYWWSEKYGGKERAVSVQIRNRKRPLFSLETLPNPAPEDAIQFEILAENPDFLLPGNKPAAFQIKAKNLTSDTHQVRIDFEVRDYLTQKVVARTENQITLTGKEEIPVKAEASLSQPGPYRGALIIRNGDQIARELKWVFTYDFPNYRAEVTRPDDFHEFWDKTLNELKQVPMEPEMKLNESLSTDSIEVFEVSLRSLNNKRFWGWYTRPKKKGSYPAYYVCPPTGVYQPGGPARLPGVCTFSIAIHGFDLHLNDMPKGPHPWKSYHTLGLESPETASWRWIYASLVRGMDFLSSRPEVDSNRIAVHGSSQGGGLALVLAGLDHRMKAVYPQYPGLPRLDWTLKYETGYWPFKMNSKPKGQSDEQFFHTLSYFDAANFTPDIQCPTVILIGLLDWVTASGNLVNAAAHLKPGQVQLICDPWGGHGSAATSYKNRHQETINRYLRENQFPILEPSK